MRKTMGCVVLSVLLVAGCQTRTGRESAYCNPGGMWMPHQISGHIETLRELGVEQPEQFTDLTGHPLGAIVWLGGCSASFVSPDGLIITNHHCATSTLQCNSTAECNRLEQGFLARTKEEELPGEIGKKVWLIHDIQDVTGLVLEGLDAVADPMERTNTIEDRIKAIIAEHEKSDEGIRCSVRSFYEQQQYYLITQFEIRDVRLVYAPHSGIGWYGGDIDNWHWPRQTGDYTFLRAYVGPDGKPAEFSKDNVPYQPKHYLKIASEPLCEGDFVMVAGFPGRTQRWRTAEELAFACTVQQPQQIAIMKEVADLYRQLGQQSEAIEIKITPSLRGVMNHLQLLEMTQDNFTQYGLVKVKEQSQAKLVQWIQSDLQRQQQWGDVFEQINQINAPRQQRWYSDYLTGCVTGYVQMIRAAHTIVRMAEERPKADEEREPEFQQRNWDRIADGLRQIQVSYDPVIDKAVLSFYLSKLCELSAEDQAPVLAAFGEEVNWDAAGMQFMIESLYRNVKLADAEYRVKLLNTATLEELQAMPDPIMQLALRLRPLTKQMDDDGKIYEGQMLLARKGYVEAINAFAGSPVAPDANGTLRITYGTVKGYRPAWYASSYRPFTTVQEMLKKHTGQPPFDVPDALIEAAKQRQGSRFESWALGDVPVDFLSDLDITGGNSGSATLNRKGELVGLVFDGNSEALASNWIFMPDITRAIHVDIRYVLWIMQDVDHADNLLQELGVK